MITTKEIELFEALFQKSPNSVLLHINNGLDDIQKLLENFVHKIDGKLIVKNLHEINFERFRLTAREYEYVIVSNCLEDIEDSDKFIKEVYHSLENSANIIMIEKNTNDNLLKMLYLLDNNDFRASNSIDIFQKYNLAMAKKMHMWGNGL